MKIPDDMIDFEEMCPHCDAVADCLCPLSFKLIPDLQCCPDCGELLIPCAECPEQVDREKGDWKDCWDCSWDEETRSCDWYRVNKSTKFPMLGERTKRVKYWLHVFEDKSVKLFRIKGCRVRIVDPDDVKEKVKEWIKQCVSSVQTSEPSAPEQSSSYSVTASTQLLEEMVEASQQ